MAATSLFLRSIALASSHRALHSATCPRHPAFFLQVRTEGLGFRRSHIFSRPFSAQALEVSEPVVKSRHSKKEKSTASSWEEAGEAFFRRQGKGGGDGGNSKEQRQEMVKVSDPSSVQSKSNRYAVKQPAFKSNFEKKNAFSEGKAGYPRQATSDVGRGREGFGRRNVGYASRESTDGYGGRGAYRNRGFREEFSIPVDDNNVTSRTSRRGSDGRNWSNVKTDFGRRSLRNDQPDDRAVARGDDGGFRKEFGDAVDSTKSYFRKGRQGGNFGKKQFPDVDGGKRMFKGRFEGDGFVKEELGHDTGVSGNRGKKTYGTAKRGQAFSKGYRDRAQKLSEYDLEPEATSEEDEDEDEDEIEDSPQAGDVIKYREMGEATRETNRMQRPIPVMDGRGQLQDEIEAQMESDEIEDEDEDEDDGRYRGRDSGVLRREQPVNSSSLPKVKGEVVYGIGPVHAALRVCRRELYCLYVQQNMPLGGGSASKKKDRKSVEWIIRTAIDKGVEVKEVAKHDLNMLSENRPHQGLILDASPLELVVSTHLEAPYTENGKTAVWVALDEVTDPQNFGAILRSAYFLGAEGVVVCAKNSAPLSAVVSKASAGALEVMELRSCKNMMKFLDWSAENGWRVVGGSAADKDVMSVRELPRGVPTILVLGGEGKGLRTNVKRSCSELVCIPGLALEGGVSRGSEPQKVKGIADVESKDNGCAPRDFTAVDSLNVSVAAGILLHELLNNQASTGILDSVQNEPDVEVTEDKKHEQRFENDGRGTCDNEPQENPDSDQGASLNDEEDEDVGTIVDVASAKEQSQDCNPDLIEVSTDEQEHRVQVLAVD